MDITSNIILIGEIPEQARLAAIELMQSRRSRHPILTSYAEEEKQNSPLQIDRDRERTSLIQPIRD